MDGGNLGFGRGYGVGAHVWRSFRMSVEKSDFCKWLAGNGLKKVLSHQKRSCDEGFRFQRSREQSGRGGRAAKAVAHAEARTKRPPHIPIAICAKKRARFLKIFSAQVSWAEISGGNLKKISRVGQEIRLAGERLPMTAWCGCVFLDLSEGTGARFGFG